jgi:hypothetical protein
MIIRSSRACFDGDFTMSIESLICVSIMVLIYFPRLRNNDGIAKTTERVEQVMT